MDSCQTTEPREKKNFFSGAKNWVYWYNTDYKDVVTSAYGFKLVWSPTKTVHLIIMSQFK